MSANDGGPAFPVQTFFNPNSGEMGNTGQYWDGNGMSLRDWFAGQALAVMLYDVQLSGSFDRYANAAYGLADAMLAERAKGGAK